jgi:hypothetical protein
MNVVPWTSISLLHNLVATYNHLLAQDGLPLPCVTYQSKIKLHGKCVGVQIRPGGVFAQSKGKMLTLPSGDMNGFATWVEEHEALFALLPKNLTIFSEWAGPGVQKKVGISEIDHKVFAVFAVQVGEGEEAEVIYDPEAICALLAPVLISQPDAMHILPWYGEELTLDFADKASFEARATELKELINQIEKCDPWVKQTFGVEGMGEGLVFYPVGEHASSNMERLGRTMFKAKGVKHSAVKTKDSVELDPEVAASLEGFVDYMVTENRLEQALSETCPNGASMRYTREFLAWLAADVQKEGGWALEKAGLEWGLPVEKAVQVAGRQWLRAKSS